jgi:UDP-2,3-diacylglucosamine hydrolase
MHAAMLADAHLKGLQDPNQHRLVAWLDQLEVDRLFLLGDVFHFWWGFADVVYGDFVPVLAALERTRRRGIPIDWIRGNHDFALGPFVENDLGIATHDSLHVDLGDRRYLLAHGDQADESVAYRMTRALLRSRLFGSFMGALGPSRARLVGETLAGASHEKQGPVDHLLEAQEKWAAPHLAAEVDVVVVGHSHSPGIRSLPGGHLVTLGDFLAHHTWLQVDCHGTPEIQWLDRVVPSP